MDDALFEVELDGTLSAYDADYELVSRETVPSQAPSPTGVDRLTMWVPSERVVLNMGAPVYEVRQASPRSYRLATRGEMDVDRGFVAQTDAHAHLYTYGAIPESKDGKEPATLASRTFVRLGVPAELVTPTFRATLPSPSVEDPPRTAWISSVFDDGVEKSPHTRDGYAMITEGHAVHESIQNHFITSSLADVRVVGQRAAVLASQGDVYIGAIPDATTTELLGHPDDATHEPTGPIREALSWFDFIKGEMETIQSEGHRYREEQELFRREPLAGVSGWREVQPGAQVGAALGHIVATASMAAPFARFMGGSSGGSVNAFGNYSISLGGGVMAGLHSELLTSIGGRATTISAGLVLSLSSSAIASLSATHLATISANAVSMSAQLGGASVRAHSTAEISSSHGKLLATSHGDAQLNSTAGCVYVHGHERFVVAAGAGAAPPLSPAAMPMGASAGYGVAGTAHELYAGHLDAAHDFGGVKPISSKSKPFLFMDQSGITLQSSGGKITLSSTGVTLEGGGVSIELGSGGIKLKSS